MRTIEGHALTNKELRVIEPGEEPEFAARPMFATINDGEHWQGPLLLLTDRRLVISKDKLIGRPKADFTADWSEVSKVSGEPWNGGGPLIQLVRPDKPCKHRVDHAASARCGSRVGNPQRV